LLALFAVAAFAPPSPSRQAFLRFSGRASRNDLTKLICDGNAEGQLVIGAGGKIIYANEAYMTWPAPIASQTCARSSGYSPDPRDFRGHLPARASLAQRQGKCRGSAFVAALNNEGEAGWYKIKVRPLAFGIGRACLWSVADVTRERERQENVFRNCGMPSIF